MTTQRTSHRIKNWPEYNQALKNRGSITFWFAEEQQNTWKSSKKSEKKGRPEVYSDYLEDKNKLYEEFENKKYYLNAVNANTNLSFF